MKWRGGNAYGDRVGKFSWGGKAGATKFAEIQEVGQTDAVSNGLDISASPNERDKLWRKNLA